MAKLFDTADAERLIQEHRLMLEELDEIAQYEDNVQMDIEKAANLVVIPKRIRRASRYSGRRDQS